MLKNTGDLQPLITLFPSCLPHSAHGTMESFSSSKTFQRAPSSREHPSVLSDQGCHCSARPKEQKSALKGSNHATVPQVSVPVLLILVGVFPVNVLRMRGGRFGCPTPETLMLPGTPPLRSPWTLLAPGLHLAIFHSVIELCVLGKISKITEPRDHINCSVFLFNSNCALFNFQIYIYIQWEVISSSNLIHFHQKNRDMKGRSWITFSLHSMNTVLHVPGGSL